jgi:hypothetical protein
MKTITFIPTEVSAIIPYSQLEVTKENLHAFTAEIQRLEKQLSKCPKLYGTRGMKEHPAIFHYFYGGTDIYICEYDQDDGLMFGFVILNGDLQNAEWGYISLEEILPIAIMNIDYHFQEQSIEAALHQKHPKYFKNPKA